MTSKNKKNRDKTGLIRGNDSVLKGLTSQVKGHLIHKKETPNTLVRIKGRDTFVFCDKEILLKRDHNQSTECVDVTSDENTL